jgi:hypothetical protein
MKDMREDGHEEEKRPRQIPNPNSNPNSKKASGDKPYDMSERLLLFADRVLYIAEDLPVARGSGKFASRLSPRGPPSAQTMKRRTALKRGRTKRRAWSRRERRRANPAGGFASSTCIGNNTST